MAKQRTGAEEAAMTREENEEEQFLRIREVLRLTGLSRATLYVMVNENQFPVPVRLRARAVAWRASQVREWMDTRPDATPENWA